MATKAHRRRPAAAAARGSAVAVARRPAGSPLRVAIVHDWLTNLGGAERVVLVMKRAFPQADLYTSVYNPQRLPQFAELNVRTSWLQGWPLAKSRHQLYPTLRQLAFESFDWHDYDVVISSSTAEAKGIVTPTEVLHISYINTPTRYYWIDYEGYLRRPGFGPLNPLVRRLLPRWIARLRRWDLAAAQRADVVIGNSQNVRARIQKYYQRDSLVLFPPVDLQRFARYPASHSTAAESARHKSVQAPRNDDFYLVVSRLIPYKKVDLVVETFAGLDRQLIVVGHGSERKRLAQLAAANPKIQFVGAPNDAAVTDYYHRCRALIFPTEEDFGITPLEAMAAGKPVIAYGRGGATETVIDGQTGLFFHRQSVSALRQAIESFERMSFEPAVIRAHAAKFSEEEFIAQLQAIVQQHRPQNRS